MNKEMYSSEVGPPRFTFVRELGRGVLGEAYEVLDEVRTEPVVLKVFLRCIPRDIDRFTMEFESLARLDHPSLVRFHHLVDPRSDTNVALEQKLGTAGLAFTQEYVYGSDLLTWLRQQPTDSDLSTLETRRTPTTGDIPLPENLDSRTIEEDSEPNSLGTGTAELSTDELTGLREESAAEIVEQMAAQRNVKVPLDLVLLRLESMVPQIVAGLQHLHRFQKVHGLLRPSNILVTRDGVCKLTDYGIVGGLAHVRKGEVCRISLLEAPEQLPYVAPEVTDDPTVAGDLYALGCVLFEAIAGYPPAEALEMASGRARKLEVPPLAEIVPECPASWADRIDALLKPDPSERPSLNALLGVVRGHEARAVQLPRSVVPEPELFVGQQSTLAKLREEARAVTDGGLMRLVLLEGPAGTGKSTIVEEISHWLSRRGWLVIGGHCFNRESIPYQGWHEIARCIGSMCDALPPSTQDLIEEDRRRASILFPSLAPPHVPAPEDAPVGRLAAIRALRRVLGVLAEQRPIVLVVEDLHWASWDTASLLMDLFSETAAIPCLVLGTWRTDTDRSGDHFLLRDLELSLLDVRRIHVGGFTTDEAREFLVAKAAGASLEDLRTVLRTGRSSPRFLQELLWELQEDRLEGVDMSRRDQILPELYRRRLVDLDKRHEAMLNLLAVASGPLEEAWLERAVVAELSGSVLPAEQTHDAIEATFAAMAERRLVRRALDGGRVEWVIAHDVCREVVLHGLSDRDRARLAGRIGDTVGEEELDRHDLRFEYGLRAGRVAKAMRSAVRAARAAERRFAYHRAAKLWRWVLENKEKLADPTVKPAAELARVEHLAGQHAEAAQLYRAAAEQGSDPVQRARLRRDEAAAWLQAGDADAAVDALDAGLGEFGETYMARWHSSVSEAPRRWLAAAARWNQSLAEVCRVGAADRPERVRGELYDFALGANALLWSERGPEIEGRLARLASGTQDAWLLGRHRMRLAVQHAGGGDPARMKRAMDWMEEAERAVEKTGDVGSTAELHLQRAILNIRFGAFEVARRSLDEVIALSRKAEDARQNDRRELLYWQAIFGLYTGRLEDAEHYARSLLHTYRGDRVAATKAYRVLSRLALYRGNAQLAEAFVDEGSRAVSSSRPNYSRMLWIREETRLHIALGRPEVAVGQLKVALERTEKAGLGDSSSFEIPLRLSMGQAACALAERHRILGEGREYEMRSLLKATRKSLEEHLGSLNALRHAEVLRLFARIALLEGKPKKALRWAEAAIEALGSVQAPLEMGKCAEARGVILARLERPEARGIIEQAWELYRQCGASFPLVLEGWPVPREAAMLKED